MSFINVSAPHPAAPIDASLEEALTHAVNFLVNPLRERISPLQLNILAEGLRVNLADRFSRHWNPHMPKVGTGARCLTFLPGGQPPKPIAQACNVAQIQWDAWFELLGNEEFDLFVDPKSVVVRQGSKSFTLWTGVTVKPMTPAAKRLSPISPITPSTADLVSSDDDEDLFRLIDTAIQQPITPIGAAPWHQRSMGHSRSSSSASDFSSTSSSSCPTSIMSANDILPAGQFTKFDEFAPVVPLLTTPAAPKRRTTKQPRIIVDATKKTVTNYDGGKVGVLTGGTMLGSTKARQ
jgi:hypothetical protein